MLDDSGNRKKYQLQGCMQSNQTVLALSCPPPSLARKGERNCFCLFNFIVDRAVWCCVSVRVRGRSKRNIYCAVSMHIRGHKINVCTGISGLCMWSVRPRVLVSHSRFGTDHKIHTCSFATTITAAPNKDNFNLKTFILRRKALRSSSPIAEHPPFVLSGGETVRFCARILLPR